MFIIFEIVAQAYLVSTLYSFKNKISEYIKYKIFNYKNLFSFFINFSGFNKYTNNKFTRKLFFWF